MDYRHYFEFLVNEIHTVILASLDPFGGPVTCALDLMHQDQEGLYFLTAYQFELDDISYLKSIYVTFNGSFYFHDFALPIKIDLRAESLPGLKTLL